MSQYNSPSDALWSSLATRVFNTDTGINALTATEQTFFAARYFSAQHFNGGLEQVFHNGTGDYYREILRALTAIGATETRGLLALAARLTFGDKTPPRDDNRRFDILMTHQGTSWEDDMDVLDGAIYRSGEDIPALADRFAKDKGLLR